MDQKPTNQVVIKLGRNWWRVPTTDGEITTEEMQPFADVPYIGTTESHTPHHADDAQPKAEVKRMLEMIKKAHAAGYRPFLRDGLIVFGPINKE